MKYSVGAILILAALALPVQAEPPHGTAIPIPEWTPAPTSPPVFGTPQIVRVVPGADGPERQVPDYAPWSDAASSLVELLADEVRTAGGELEEGDEAIIVTGSEEIVDLVRRRVGAVDRYLTGRSTVAVQLVALPMEDLPEEPTAADIGGLVRSAPKSLLWTGRFELRRGEGGLREEVAERSFVFAHNADVAQHASIVELMTASLRTGRRVYVSSRPVSGEAAQLTLSVGLSRAPDEIRAVETSSGPIDLPEVAFFSLTTSLRVTVGASSVVVVDSPFGPGRIAVVVSLLQIAPSDDTPFSLVDLAALAGHPDVVDAAPALGVGVLAHDAQRPGGYDDEYGPTADERRGELITALLETLEGTGARVVQLSPAVVAIGGPADARARVLSILSRADTQGRISRQTYRVPWNELVTTPGFDPITGEITAAELSEGAKGSDAVERTGPLALPVSGHTPLLLTSGTWRRFLEGMEVEIAEGAAVVRPVVGTYVAGEAIVMRPHDSALWRQPQITLARSEILGLVPRDLEVRRDIMGKRTDLSGHKLDILHTADSQVSILLVAPGATTLDRVGATSVIHLWSR